MIKGIGIDTVDINRIKKSLEIKGFLTSTFTENEINNCHGNVNEYYATRFAAKEALYKAINKYLSVDLRTIETLNNSDGSPYIVMKKEYIDAGISKIHISITTEANLASAFCIIE